jgi:hypothetical protein
MLTVIVYELELGAISYAALEAMQLPIVSAPMLVMVPELVLHVVDPDPVHWYSFVSKRNELWDAEIDRDAGL